MSMLDLSCRHNRKRAISHGGMKKHLRACKKSPTNIIQRTRQPSPISRNGRQVPIYSLTAAILAGYARRVYVDIKTSPYGSDIYGEAEQEPTPEQANSIIDDYTADAVDDNSTPVATSSTHGTHGDGLLSATSMQSLHRVSYTYDNQMRADASVGESLRNPE